MALGLARMLRGGRAPFSRAVWLFPAAVSAHVLEEAPGFTAWALA